jgi:hypothetical protein
VSEQPAPVEAPATSPSGADGGPPERRSAAQQVSAYASGSVANMLRSLLVIGVIMAVIVLMFPNTQPQTPDVDVVETAQQIEGSTGWTLEVPLDLPEGWEATRAQYRRSTDGLMTWHAGFQTPSGDYAALQQTLDATDAWVTTQVNRSPRAGELEVAGRAWEQYDRSGKVQRSLVDRGGPGEMTTVVTGTASWEEMQAFAASLGPVPATP